MRVPKTNSLLVNNSAPIDRSTRGTSTGLYRGAKIERPVFPGFSHFKARESQFCSRRVALGEEKIEKIANEKNREHFDSDAQRIASL